MEFKPIVNVVDDDPDARDSMKMLLESAALKVEGFDTARGFLASSNLRRPGCILLDLRMPEMSGLELLDALREKDVHTPVIFITGYANVPAAVRGMQSGAIDFLSKPVNDETVIEKVHQAIARDRELRAEALKNSTLRARIALLTPRERQVLEGVVAGKSNKKLANELSLSHKTVELHRGNMMTKMHATSVADVVRMRLSVDVD